MIRSMIKRPGYLYSRKLAKAALFFTAKGPRFRCNFVWKMRKGPTDRFLAWTQHTRCSEKVKNFRTVYVPKISRISEQSLFQKYQEYQNSLCSKNIKNIRTVYVPKISRISEHALFRKSQEYQNSLCSKNIKNIRTVYVPKISRISEQSMFRKCWETRNI